MNYYDCGIYGIFCKSNKKVYVGSTMYLLKRERDHFNLLQDKKHWNISLQEDFNKYGKENFEWKTLHRCNENDLEKIEQYYINLYKSDNFEFGYNKIYKGRKKISNAYLKYKNCIAEWKILRKQGMSYYKIAKKYNTADVTVSDYLKIYYPGDKITQPLPTRGYIKTDFK